MERLLGKACELARPNTGLGAFLAGVYGGMRSGLGRFGTGTAKGIASALLFACIPQSTAPLGAGDEPEWEVFVDGAPAESGFRVGVVGEKGFYRSKMCPPWVHTLQQAELFAVYEVAKIAAYRRVHRERIGSDSNVARAQINALRASATNESQQRILRRLFWLRCWSATTVSSFRVKSAHNPADPLSRVKSFQSRSQAVAEAEHCRGIWVQADEER